MNQFQSVIESLLGWLRGIAQSLWGLFGGTGSGGLPGWLAANWKGLLILLCILGVALDLTVYLFRWKPYRVWNSFMRRRQERAFVRQTRGEEWPEETPEYEEPAGEDVYAAPLAEDPGEGVCDAYLNYYVDTMDDDGGDYEEYYEPRREEFGQAVDLAGEFLDGAVDCGE